MSSVISRFLTLDIIKANTLLLCLLNKTSNDLLSPLRKFCTNTLSEKLSNNIYFFLVNKNLKVNV